MLPPHRWLNAAGSLVAWLWNFATDFIISVGPAATEMRQPVIENDFEQPLTVIT